jgi:muramoyltetrapeptide carboxypeptidase
MSSLLPPGSRVAVVAPSHAFDDAKLAEGMAWATTLDLDLVELPHMRATHRRFAAPLAARLESLTQALTDPDFDAVWVARGGSGLLQLVDHLPYPDIDDRPVLGFSDVTALFCALDRRGAATCVHAPVLHSLQGTDEASRAQLRALLRGSATTWEGEAWSTGAAEGPLVGGNLTVLASTCGTRHQLRSEGRIVLLEEIGEHPYRVERSLQQLLSAGALDGARGIALGSFTSCEPPPSATWRLVDGLREMLLPLGIPIVADLPVGHGPTNHSFVWGTHTHIERGTLHLEPHDHRSTP